MLGSGRNTSPQNPDARGLYQSLDLDVTALEARVFKSTGYKIRIKKDCFLQTD